MATDFLVHYMTGPIGLAVIAGAVAFPFLIWRILLGRAFGQLGFMPLAIAYASAFSGLLLLCFASSHLDFSRRVALGLLAESERWSIVPGWTAYLAILSLWIVLPGLALVCVPLAALLLKHRRLSPLNVTMVALVLWLALALAIWWTLPTNDWQRTHRVEYALRLLKDQLLGILSVPVPFFLTLLLLARARQAEP